MYLLTRCYYRIFFSTCLFSTPFNVCCCPHRMMLIWFAHFLLCPFVCLVPVRAHVAFLLRVLFVLCHTKFVPILGLLCPYSVVMVRRIAYFALPFVPVRLLPRAGPACRPGRGKAGGGCAAPPLPTPTTRLHHQACQAARPTPSRCRLLRLSAGRCWCCPPVPQGDASKRAAVDPALPASSALHPPPDLGTVD